MLNNAYVPVEVDRESLSLQNKHREFAVETARVKMTLGNTSIL